jgi:hypothetical protein
VTAFGVCLGAGAPALSQTAKQSSVTAQARPDYDPIGLQLGTLLSIAFGGPEEGYEALNSFLVFPKFAVESEYTDNVFNAETDKVSDKIISFKPSLNITSDWVNHALAVSGEATVGRHFKANNENFEDYKGSVKGRLDVAAQSNITAGITHERRHEGRGAPDDPGVTFGPTVSFDTTFELDGEFSTDPLIARVESSAKRTDVLDNGSINNDDRDVWKLVIRPRLGYESFEDTALFVQPGFTAHVFDVKVDDDDINNDSQEYELLVGLTYDFGEVTFLDIAVGVAHTRFDDPAFKPITTPSFEETLIWNVTELVTITSKARRTSSFSVARNDPTFLTRSSVTTTMSFQLAADWEARDNLLVNARAGVSSSDFEGEETDGTEARQDNEFTFGLSARYLIGQNVFASAEYSLTKRDSNEVGSSFTTNRFLMRLGVQL